MKLCLKFKKELVEKYQIDIIKEFILTLQKSLPLKGELEILLLDDSTFNGAANRLQGLTVNTIAVVTE